MPLGPGKYDDIATLVREMARAVDGGVVILVAGGNRGNGFSVQGTAPFMLTLPSMLRKVADSIEKDLERLPMGGEKDDER